MPSRDYIQQMAERRFQGEVRNRLEEALESVRDDIPLDQLAEAIEQGDAERALQLAGVSAASATAISGGLTPPPLPDDTAAKFDDMRGATVGAFDAGGRATTETVPPLREGDGTILRVTFSPGDERAQRRVDGLHVQQIREIGEETRQLIREEIRTGLGKGENPRDTARRIRGSIGLTSHQAGDVRRAEQQLRSADPDELRKYLGRKLRDRRFDRTIVKAINNGTAVSEETINKATARYRERYVKARAETIARDQALEALTQGQEEALDQAVEQGVLRSDEVRMEWVTARDARVRNFHQQIPAMNRGGVPRGQQYSTPLGPLQRPRDRTSAGSVPANVINCLCSQFPRIQRNRNVPQG